MLMALVRFLVSFNPRPLLLTGESVTAEISEGVPTGFNPRPLLLTGESVRPLSHAGVAEVSIHARYC